jgi:hypothetical protein
MTGTSNTVARIVRRATLTIATCLVAVGLMATGFAFPIVPHPSTAGQIVATR